MRRLAAVWAGCIWLGAQSGAQSPAQSASGAGESGDDATRNAMLLTHISQHMMGNLKRQPNYTCIETVERWHRAASTRKYQLLDTIRLEVGLVDGKEMFAWPGAKKFENAELSEIIGGTGAIANGDFALHARAIFGSGTATFAYRGTGETDGRLWVRFDYHVALMRSGFELKVGDRKAVVAYHGSFEADPASLDVERLDVIADEIPPDLGLRVTTDHLEYARTRIGDGDFLLPSQSELTMANLDGTENRNHIRFASCRQVTGESVVTFDAPPSTADATARIAEVELPPDLDVTLVLIDDIDLANAAIGDPVRARLQNDLKFKGRVLMPKSAIAAGRVTRIERHTDYVMLGLMFDELESPGARAHPKLRMMSLMGAPHIGSRGNYVLSAPRPGEGILPIPASSRRVSHGVTMIWSTEAKSQ